MKNFLVVSVLLLFSCAEENTQEVVELVSKCENTVVMILAQDQDGKKTSQGSGVVATADGKIITNLHVVKDAYSCYVKFFDKGFFPVEGVVAVLPEKDIAILQVRGNFQSAVLGNADNLQKGEKVVAIGNPKGIESVPSEGTFSGLHQNENGMNFLHFSAPVSHGSSGGGLFNLKGEVVGITTAIIEDGQNLNLAVPINEVFIFLNRNELAQTYAQGSKPAEEDLTIRETGLNKFYRLAGALVLVLALFFITKFLFKSALDNDKSPVKAHSFWTGIFLSVSALITFLCLVAPDFKVNWWIWMLVFMLVAAVIFVINLKKSAVN
ncbi:trypsin-like peptidase domain-containing protein [bacterium]|nr:trypsin-like peptidase domain-containing protein [bacterium]